MTAPTDPIALPDAGLVGESRQLLVEGLVRAFDAVASSGLPLWVSLEGPSGWGKTRVVQELYSRLAAERQDAPSYWPATMIADDTNPQPDRKRINPVVAHRPGSRPAWAWWGIACAQRNGVATVALAQDVAVLEAHAPYLELTWRARNPRGVAASVLDKAAVAGVNVVVGGLAEVVLPGFDFAKRLAQYTFGAARDAHGRRALERNDETLTPDHVDMVQGITETIVRLAAGGIPIIIVIEDVHVADETLADLLHDLVAENAPILIVSTAWPGHVDDNPHLVRALASYPERLLRVSASGEAPPRPFPPGAGLGPLPDAALDIIARRALPPIDEATLARVISRYPNPLALELFGTLPAVRTRARGGILSLSDEQLERFPPSLIGLYRDVWDALPDEVRHALVLATLGIPEAISPGSGSSYWNREALFDIARSLGLPSADGLARELAHAPTAYQWARSVSDVLHAFTEPEQLRIAREAEFGYVDDDEKLAIYGELVRRAADALQGDSRVATEESTHAAQLILALYREGFVTDAAPVVAASLHLLEALRERPREWRVREELLDRAIPLATDAADLLRLIEFRAELHRALGLASSALEMLRAAIPAAVTLLGAQHPLVLRARHALGAALSDEGRWEEAISEAEEVLQVQRETLGDDHIDTLRTRAGIAFDTERVRGADGAMSLLTAVYRDGQRLLGTEDANTIKWGMWMARAMASAGCPVSALGELERLLEVATRVFGAAAPVTLRLRAAEVDLLRMLGRTQQEGEAFEQLFRDAEAALGSSDSFMIWLAADYASTVMGAGQVDAALDLRRGVVAAQAATVGEGDFRWFAASMSYADDLAGADPASALAQFEQLLGEMATVLGVDASETLRARRRVIELGLDANTLSSAEAGAQLERLAAEITELIGETVSPAIAREAAVELLAVQWSRVTLLAEGEPDEALRLADETADAELARPGASIEDRLAARGSRAHARLASRPGEALALYCEILDEIASEVDGEIAELGITNGLRLDAAAAASSAGDDVLAFEFALDAVNRALDVGLAGSPAQLRVLDLFAGYASAIGADGDAQQARVTAAQLSLERFGVGHWRTLLALVAAMDQLASTDLDGLIEFADRVAPLLDSAGSADGAISPMPGEAALVYIWMSIGYREAGRGADADEFATRLIDLRATALAQCPPDADARDRLVLGELHASAVQFAEGDDAARPYYSALLAEAIVVLDADDPLLEELRDGVATG